MAEDLNAEETEIYEDLAERAGVVARRLLADQGLVYLDDLPPEAARELLRIAWREAAQERFQGMNITELHAEIDAMVASLIMADPASGSRQRSPLRLTNTMPLSTRRSSTRGLPCLFGKNGRSRSICSSVSQNRSLIPVSSRSLNQIATLISMGPDHSRSQHPPCRVNSRRQPFSGSWSGL